MLLKRRGCGKRGGAGWTTLLQKNMGCCTYLKSCIAWQNPSTPLGSPGAWYVPRLLPPVVLPLDLRTHGSGGRGAFTPTPLGRNGGHRFLGAWPSLKSIKQKSLKREEIKKLQLVAP